MTQKKNAPAIQSDSQSEAEAQILSTAQHAANRAVGSAHCIIQCDFDGQSHSFNEAGWFNATEAAARFSKKANEWLRLPGTASYLAAFRRKYGNIPHLKTRRGIGGGTWLHPKLAVRFAQWLSDDFAVWCDEQIDAILRRAIEADTRTHLLPLLLRQEPGTWERRFGPDYYHALAHLTNTTYTGHVGGTPALYGAITDQWVYAVVLPTDVYAELKIRSGASQKMHQWLADGGLVLLMQQINRVRDTASTSADLCDFKARMMRLTERRGQLGFVYPARCSAE